MEQKRPRRPTHAEDDELAAITREIHAQLRTVYAAEARSEPAPPSTPKSSLAAMRFVTGFLLPPLLMVALALLLHYLTEG